MQKDEKNIDIELLLFYLGISVISFILYIIRHPLLNSFYKQNRITDLIFAYLPDLIIFLSVFVPYFIYVIILIIIKITKQIKISDNLFVILFFPILSFFTKGMSLLQVYLYSNLYEIIKDNFAFFSFLLAGPLLVLFNKLILFVYTNIQKLRIQKR